ncbi:glycerol-3-phosphate dehydrogenase C-terminal domain-containing protein [Cytobacillus citreus]|uniref:glycerol-3-phosphate dehydrogenase C-terminal domain-containing protein n=1 Tax=Cytobacillus citreus TaxID=2833586 RepID=UPI003B82DDBA
METEGVPRLIRLLIQYSVHYEMVMTASDFFVRRTGAILFNIEWVKKWKYLIIRMFQTIFNWDEKVTNFPNEKAHTGHSLSLDVG